MSEQDTRRRLRRWTKRAARPIVYGPFARLADWWCAGRDARKGLPALIVPIELPSVRAAIHDKVDAGPPELVGLTDHPWSEPDMPTAAEAHDLWAGAPEAPDGPDAQAGQPALAEKPLGTPRLMFLGYLGLGMLEREWLRYKAEVADYLTDLSQARVRRELLAAELELAEERLQDIPVTPSEAGLTERIGGEERTAAPVVRDRRLKAHRSKRARAEDAVRQILAEQQNLELQVARLGEPVRVRFEVLLSRAAAIEAHIRRRSAAYLTRLVRKHGDGKKINERLRPYWPQLPEWTGGDRSPDLADLPTGAGTARFGGRGRAAGTHTATRQPATGQPATGQPVTGQPATGR